MTTKKTVKQKKVKSVTEEHRELMSSLMNFGLSENETRIYVYLLERGEAVGGGAPAAERVGVRQHAGVGVDDRPTMLGGPHGPHDGRSRGSAQQRRATRERP